MQELGRPVVQRVHATLQDRHNYEVSVSYVPLLQRQDVVAALKYLKAVALQITQFCLVSPLHTWHE